LFQIAAYLEGFLTEDNQENEGLDQTDFTEKSSFSSLPSVYSYLNHQPSPRLRLGRPAFAQLRHVELLNR